MLTVVIEFSGQNTVSRRCAGTNGNGQAIIHGVTSQSLKNNKLFRPDLQNNPRLIGQITTEKYSHDLDLIGIPPLRLLCFPSLFGLLVYLPYTRTTLRINKPLNFPPLNNILNLIKINVVLIFDNAYKLQV